MAREALHSGERWQGIACSQVDFLEAGGGDPVGEDVARDENRGPDREDDQLRPDVLTHHVQVGAEEGNDVDQDLGETTPATMKGTPMLWAVL